MRLNFSDLSLRELEWAYSQAVGGEISADEALRLVRKFKEERRTRWKLLAARVGASMFRRRIYGDTLKIA